eukprot:982668-Amphidinium_carterae.2
MKPSSHSVTPCGKSVSNYVPFMPQDSVMTPREQLVRSAVVLTIRPSAFSLKWQFLRCGLGQRHCVPVHPKTRISNLIPPVCLELGVVQHWEELDARATACLCQTHH